MKGKSQKCLYLHFHRYGITLVVTVASIVLSRLPEKLAIILMSTNDGYDVADNTIILDSSLRPLDCIGTHSENGEAGKNVMYPSLNETTMYSNEGITVTRMPYTAQTIYDEFEFLGWAGQWAMKLPLFILSFLNPWLYAYHNVDFKRCMNRYVRKILKGWKLIGKEAKSNAGIFATVKLDRSYITTAQVAGSNAGKAVLCSLHNCLSSSVAQGQATANNPNGTNHAVFPCTCGHNNVLSPPPSPSPSSDYMRNITYHMTSSQKRLDNAKISLSRYVKCINVSYKYLM